MVGVITMPAAYYKVRAMGYRPLPLLLPVVDAGGGGDGTISVELSHFDSTSKHSGFV